MLNKSKDLSHLISQQSEQIQLLKYTQLISAATDDLLSFVDTQYIYRSVNLAYCKKFNKTMEEIVGHSVKELHGEDVFYGGLKESLDISLVAGKSTKTEFSREAPDSTTHWIRGQHNPYFDEHGCIAGVVVAAIDITDLKETEIALAESESRLQAMYDDTPSMFFTINREMLITSVNSFAVRELGYKKSELLGVSVDTLFKAEDRVKLTENIQACFSNHDIVKSWSFEKLTEEVRSYG